MDRTANQASLACRSQLCCLRPERHLRGALIATFESAISTRRALASSASGTSATASRRAHSSRRLPSNTPAMASYPHQRNRSPSRFSRHSRHATPDDEAGSQGASQSEVSWRGRV